MPVRSGLLFLVFLTIIALPDALFATEQSTNLAAPEPLRVALFRSEWAIAPIDDGSLHRLAGISISLLSITAAYVLGIPEPFGVASAAAVAVLAGGVKELFDSFGFGTPETRDFVNTSVGALVGAAIMLFGGATGLGEENLYAKSAVLFAVPIIAFYVDRLGNSR